MHGGPMSESCSSKPAASGCGCGSDVKFDGGAMARRVKAATKAFDACPAQRLAEARFGDAAGQQGVAHFGTEQARAGTRHRGVAGANTFICTRLVCGVDVVLEATSAVSFLALPVSC